MSRLQRSGCISIAAFLVSVVSLLVSWATNWRTTLAPFDPQIILGGIFWRLETPKGETSPVTTVVSLIVFVNRGAREGCILDVSADLKASRRRATWKFYPAFYINLDRYIEGLHSGKTGAEVAEAPFYPVFLAGRSQVVKMVMLLPRDRTASVAQEDEYLVEVAGRVCGENAYRVGDRKTFELGREQVAALQGGNAVWTVSKEVRRE